MAQLEGLARQSFGRTVVRRSRPLTGRRTVPKFFIGPTHVGGGDDPVELDHRGGLLPLLGTAGQAHAGALRAGVGAGR